MLLNRIKQRAKRSKPPVNLMVTVHRTRCPKGISRRDSKPLAGGKRSDTTGLDRFLTRIPEGCLVLAMSQRGNLLIWVDAAIPPGYRGLHADKPVVSLRSTTGKWL